jgi:hypothetical protein
MYGCNLYLQLGSGIFAWQLGASMYAQLIGQRSPGSVDPASSTAGLGHLQRSPGLAASKGHNCTLRRCTCGGIIALPMFGVGPSFKVFKTKKVAGR